MKRRKAGSGAAETGRTDLVCKLCGIMDDRLSQHVKEKHIDKLRKTFEDGLDSLVELETAKASGENDKSALSDKLRREATADFEAEMEQLRDEVTSFGWAKHYEYLRYQAVNVSEITDMLGAEYVGAAARVGNFLAGRGCVIQNDAPCATTSIQRGSASTASRQPQRTAEDEDESLSQEMFAGSALHGCLFSSIVAGPHTVGVAQSTDEAENLSVERSNSLPRVAESAVGRPQRSRTIADDAALAATRKSVQGLRSASTSASRRVDFFTAATGEQAIPENFGLNGMFVDPPLPDYLFSSIVAGPNTAAAGQCADASEGLSVGLTNSLPPASERVVRRSQRSHRTANQCPSAVTRKSSRASRAASTSATRHVGMGSTSATDVRTISASFAVNELFIGQRMINDGTPGDIVDQPAAACEQQDEDPFDSPDDISASFLTHDIVSSVAQYSHASTNQAPHTLTYAQASYAEGRRLKNDAQKPFTNKIVYSESLQQLQRTLPPPSQDIQRDIAAESAVRRPQHSRPNADDVARPVTRKTAAALRSASTSATRHFGVDNASAKGAQEISVSFPINGMYDYFPVRSMKLLKREKAQMFGANLAHIVRTREVIDDIMKWTVLCALEKQCMAPQGQERLCDFKQQNQFTVYANCHRHDQSAINLLLANKLAYNCERWTSGIPD